MSQQKCEVNQPIGMIKQELHEVDVWIGQDNSEAGKTGTICCIMVDNIIRTVRFFNVLKEVSSAYQGFIYLIQNTSKTVILWNICTNLNGFLFECF